MALAGYAHFLLQYLWSSLTEPESIGASAYGPVAHETHLQIQERLEASR
jgi:hypothetical protein